MSTKSGVGFSNKSDSIAAGVEMGQAALAQLGDKNPGFAFLYSTSKHDPAKLKEGVSSVLGKDCMVVGGWSVGIITKDNLGYGGFEAGVAVFKSDSVSFDTFVAGGLGTGNELKVGMDLGKQIAAKKYGDNWNIFMKYDSIRMDRKPLPMNMGTPIVTGMTEAMGGKWPPAVGIGLLGDMQFNPTFQWYGDKIINQSAMAVVMHGKKIHLDTMIMHGCKPSGSYHKVTKVDGAVILEIDGKKAIDAITEMLGPNSDKSWEQYPLFITLGWNKGDKFADFKEENYANRLCIAIDKERGGLVMLEDDIKEGTEVQLMRRNISDFKYIRERSEELLKSLKDRKPFFAFYIDCAGRASAYCGSETEEASEVQKVIGTKMPMLGVYSGVELAKVGKQDMMALDWTGILCVYSE